VLFFYLPSIGQLFRIPVAPGPHWPLHYIRPALKAKRPGLFFYIVSAQNDTINIIFILSTAENFSTDVSYEYNNNNSNNNNNNNNNEYSTHKAAVEVAAAGIRK